MSVFSWFIGGQARPKPASQLDRRYRPVLEVLEDRTMPSCATISGYVFQDANNNGLFDTTELPIANSTLQLRDAGNQVVATTTSNGAGYYEFDYDPTISQVPRTLIQTITFAEAETDFSLTEAINQFDPALGQLQAVTIQHDGFITSTIRVENTSTRSTSTIRATVAGVLTLEGGGTTIELTPTDNVGTYAASRFDGVLDFAGTSGKTFAPRTASASREVALTGNALNPFLGTGTVAFTENVEAASSATGGGNLRTEILSTGGGVVTVTYTYVPSNCLQPGNYSIAQASQPPGFLDGQESRDGVVLNNPPGVSVIPVTLSNRNLVNNNFGELPPASISGYVYVDANLDGARNPGEGGIANVQLALGGTTYLGTSVNLTATTAASGFYQFQNLLPGTYEVRETQPSNFLDGQDAVGSQGGSSANDRLYDLRLSPGSNGVDNNFGELAPASLAGYVYVDGNDNGSKDLGEAGLAGVQITLGGNDYRGNPVTAATTTAADGSYSFRNLLPGTYSLTETQPPNYNDGRDAIGSQGGSTANDRFYNIALALGVNGVNNNFGEIAPADLAIQKTANLGSVVVGGQVQYTLTVSNLGTHTAQTVVVTDLLPSNTVVLGNLNPGWNVTLVGQTLTFTRPALAVGQTSTIVITVRAPLVAGIMPNTATVSSQTPDPDPANNTARTTTLVYNQPGYSFPRTVQPLALRVTSIPIITKRQVISGRIAGLDSATLSRLAWIDGVYQTLLGRSPTGPELMAAWQHLASGGNRAQLTSMLWNTYQHRAMQVTNFFQVFYRRNPTAAELPTYVAQLQAGMSETQLALNFMLSAEYQHSHPTPEALVAGFYQDLQGIVPDLSTLLLNVQALGSSNMSSFASSMLNSQATLSYLVDGCYRSVLRRAATTAEIQYWVAQLQGRLITPGGLVQTLLASDLFVHLAVAWARP